VCHPTKGSQRNKVGFYDNTTATTSSLSSSVRATNYSLCQSVSSLSHPLQIPHPVSVTAPIPIPTPALANAVFRVYNAFQFECVYTQNPSFVPVWLAFITFPICALKNYINVIQMINAAKALAEVDREERRRDRLSGVGKQS
jgi:hypothetical protein